MRGILAALALGTAVGILPATGFPLNLKRAPESKDDLMAIQKALQAALPQANAATVAIDLGDGSGTGVIVSKDGLVMTAAHVSGGVGKDVEVVMPDGTKLKAETLGLMAETDAALIQISETPEGGGDFPFVEINNSDEPKLGDWIFSLGHAGGFNKDRGAVVRLGRLVRVANATYQTDGSLIGGDSGGPLFDMDGRLVGIHSRVGQQLPVNMHVPVKVFLEGWEKMLESEFVGEGPFAEKPVKGTGFLGVATKDVEGGLEITKVGKGSPAEKKGLKEGDLLETFNGEKLTTREDMNLLLAEMAAGEELTLGFKRDGQIETITLRLEKR